MYKAKYFTEEEVKGLDQELIPMLDMARHKAGIEFIITSGFRTKEQNDAIGGTSDSAHLKGQAVDLACSDSPSRFKIVKALLDTGFRRIEIADLHVHADIDKEKAYDVIFLGKSR